MNLKNVKPYVGLAQKQNAVLYGEDIIKEKISKVKVILVDANASTKYKERITTKFTGYPLFFIDNMEDAVHKDNVKSIAITQETLANAIIGLLKEC